MMGKNGRKLTLKERFTFIFTLICYLIGLYKIVQAFMVIVFVLTNKLVDKCSNKKELTEDDK